MSDLATLAIDAHGGLDRWRHLKTVSARLVQSGVLWQLKGQNGVLDDVHVSIDLHKEWASHRPFGHRSLSEAIISRGAPRGPFGCPFLRAKAVGRPPKQRSPYSARR